MSKLTSANWGFTLAATLAVAAPFAFGRAPKISGIAYPITGIVALVATGQGKRDEDQQAANPVEYAMAGLESLSEGVAGCVGRFGQQGAKQVRKVAVRYDVPVLPEVLAKANNNAAIDQAFKDIHKRSFLAIANTGGGKTFFLHQSAAWAIEQGEHVIICDRSYGKRGQHWFQLPVADRATNTPGIVFEGSPDDLEACVTMFFNERERRARETKAAARRGKPQPNFQRWALYLPERTESLIEYRDAYGDDLADELSKKINSLLRDGHGYDVFLRSDAQSAATGEVEISEGMRKNLHWIFFGDAVETKEIGKVGIDKEWVGKVAKARGEHGKYLGLALIEGQPQFIKAPNHEYDFSDAMTHDQAATAWLESLKPELAKAEGSSPTALFDSFKSRFPQGHKNKGADNPYWQAFKSFVENQEN